MKIVKVGARLTLELEVAFLHCSIKSGGNQEPQGFLGAGNTGSVQDSKKKALQVTLETSGSTSSEKLPCSVNRSLSSLSVSIVIICLRPLIDFFSACTTTWTYFALCLLTAAPTNVSLFPPPPHSQNISSLVARTVLSGSWLNPQCLPWCLLHIVNSW